MIATLRRKFKSLTSDKKFSEILTGSVWALAARVVATVLGLVTSIIIARMYGGHPGGDSSIFDVRNHCHRAGNEYVDFEVDP
jgi:ABC-type spermidine/putrescine transport system permease subunit II